MTSPRASTSSLQPLAHANWPDLPKTADAQGISAVVPMYDGRDPVLCEARRMYQRVLAAWASDVLMLRRQGGLRPQWRPSRVPGSMVGRRAS